MAFERPTLAAIVDRVQQDLVSRLETSGAVLRRSVVHVLARVIAGASHMLHGHIEFIARQIFPDRSERDFLVRQAELYGIQPSPATFASASVLVTGAEGTPIPQGTRLLRADGAAYEITAAAVIGEEGVTVEVMAVEAGADGTLDAGVVLVFESPIEGAEAEAAVTESLHPGADQERTESLRERLIARLRMPPHGGAHADYAAWTREVPGVSRVWVAPRELGAGTVTVRFVRDDDPEIIPDAEAVAEVKAYLEERRPVTAHVVVLAPVPVPLDLTVHLDPDTANTRLAAAAELEDMLRRHAAPGGTVTVAQIRRALDQAEGVVNYALVEPTTDKPHGIGELPVLGTITWE